MLEILNYLKARYMSERAQGIVEYALILAFVAVVAVALFGNSGMSTYIKNVFIKIEDLLLKGSNAS